MENIHFGEWGGLGFPHTEPVTQTQFETNKLSWDVTMTLQFSYTPYLVQFSNLTWDANGKAASFSFQFLDCAVASYSPVGRTYSITLPDWGLLHHPRPSTLPSQADVAAGKTIGFVFLHKNEMARFDANLPGDAALANITPPDTGKFPRGSDLESVLERMSAARSTEKRNGTGNGAGIDHTGLIRWLVEDGDNLTSKQRVKLLAALTGR